MRSPSKKGDAPDLTPVQRSYQKALRTLNAAGIPYLVGGAHGLRHYTGVHRDTKDLDLFVLADDRTRGLEALHRAGYSTVLAYPHWLAEAIDEQVSIDIIFSSGNAIGTVDSNWFTHAVAGELLGQRVKFVPPEEIIWSKAFVMERERYDGADIMHLLLSQGETLDWARLLDRFGPHWRVLFSYLVLFGFIYPSQRSLVPGWLMAELGRRLEEETTGTPPPDRICQGTLLSREQYGIDIEKWGFSDARLIPLGKMTADEIESWKG